MYNNHVILSEVEGSYAIQKALRTALDSSTSLRMTFRNDL